MSIFYNFNLLIISVESIRYSSIIGSVLTVRNYVQGRRQFDFQIIIVLELPLLEFVRKLHRNYVLDSDSI